jgi:hypothetical protein
MCTHISRYKNNVRHKNQDKTLDSAIKIQACKWDLLAPRHINVSQLNLKVRLLRRSDKCVETSVYTLTAVTEVTMLISNCTLTDNLPYQQLQHLQFCLTNPGRIDYSILFSPFININFNIIIDSFLHTVCI